MPTIGDTVRIKAEFRDFEDNLVSPNGVTFTMYDGKRAVLGDVVNLSPVSTGVYQLDYVVPSTGTDPLCYEVKGTLDSLPILARAELNRKWV